MCRSDLGGERPFFGPNAAPHIYAHMGPLNVALIFLHTPHLEQWDILDSLGGVPSLKYTHKRILFVVYLKDYCRIIFSHQRA